jgi:hypothetical protein
MPRSLVDPDRDTACSVGLHVGNFSYASGFAQKLLTVAVNPRDVVAVPSDSGDQKIRTHRFTVLGENLDKTQVTGTSYVVADDYEDTYYPEQGDEEDADW